MLLEQPNKTKEKNDCEYTKLQSFLALKKDPALILFVMRLSYYSIIVRANKSQNIQYIIDCQKKSKIGKYLIFLKNRKILKKYLKIFVGSNYHNLLLCIC